LLWEDQLEADWEAERDGLGEETKYVYVGRRQNKKESRQEEGNTIPLPTDPHMVAFKATVEERVRVANSKEKAAVAGIQKIVESARKSVAKVETNTVPVVEVIPVIEVKESTLFVGPVSSPQTGVLAAPGGKKEVVKSTPLASPLKQEKLTQVMLPQIKELPGSSQIATPSDGFILVQTGKQRKEQKKMNTQLSFADIVSAQSTQLGVGVTPSKPAQGSLGMSSTNISPPLVNGSIIPGPTQGQPTSASLNIMSGVSKESTSQKSILDRKKELKDLLALSQKKEEEMQQRFDLSRLSKLVNSMKKAPFTVDHMKTLFEECENVTIADSVGLFSGTIDLLTIMDKLSKRNLRQILPQQSKQSKGTPIRGTP
jgi:hypothetical protein